MSSPEPVDGRPGPLIGRGRHADVYDIGDGLVLRRYRYQRDTIAQVLAMRAAKDGGYPVPDVIRSDGTDITMARVEGPTMLHEIARYPWQLRHHASVLAELHERLHDIVAPEGLEQPLGEGRRLLHMDLQPENVVLNPQRGPVVLDWEWAVMGPPSADVAHTWLQLATSEIPGSRWRRLIGAAGGRAFVGAFLTRVDREAAAAQMEMVRQYRLARRDLTARERRNITTFKGAG